MKYLVLSLCSLLMLISGKHATAQDTSLVDAEVVVVKTYTPILSDAKKLKVNPNPEIPDVKPLQLSYKIPGRAMSIRPNIEIKKPISLGRTRLTRLKNNYTKVGYGNFATPLLELSLNTLRSKSYNAGLYYHHLSSKGKEEFADFSSNTAGVYARKFYKKHHLSVASDFDRQTVRLYGYDRNNGFTFDDDTLKQSFRNFNIAGNLVNVTTDSADFRYRLGIDFNSFDASRAGQESNFRFIGGASKMINGSPLEVDAEIDVNTLKDEATSLDYQRLFIRLRPRFTLSEKHWSLKLGFNATLFDDSLDNKLFLYPYALGQYELIPSRITAFAGLNGDVEKNTYRRFAEQTPFLSAIPTLRNSLNRFELFLGVKGSISGQTGYVLQAGLRNMENLALFLTDPIFNGTVVAYDTGSSTVYNVRGEISHQYGEKLRFNFIGNLYRYNLDQQDEAWQLPTADLQVNATYNMGDKIYLKADVFALNSRFARILGTAETREFKGITDFNLGVDYRYTKDISLFLNFNNLAASRYNRWYNYRVNGFNLIGGLTFTL